jgi:hypothetical protein
MPATTRREEFTRLSEIDHLTYEQIGAMQTPRLSRQRVHQIINGNTEYLNRFDWFRTATKIRNKHRYHIKHPEVKRTKPCEKCEATDV